MNTLNLYHTHDVNPKGLRISVQPAASDMPSDLKARWAECLHGASRQLLDIVIQHDSSQLQLLLSEEKKFTEQNCLTASEIRLLEKFTKDKENQMATTKRKKLLRDGVTQPPETVQSSGFRHPPVQGGVPGDNASQPKQCNIVNLSDIPLTVDEQRVLSKGLSFCPATGRLDEFQLYKDLDNFARTLRLNEYYYGRTQETNIDIRLPSLRHWTPPSQRDKCLDIYIKAVQRDILSEYRNQSPYQKNLSKSEEKALQGLGERSDIIIKPADKGGAIVIMNQQDYISEARKQLSDTSFYTLSDTDQTTHYKSEVRQTLAILVKKNMVDPPVKGIGITRK